MTQFAAETKFLLSPAQAAAVLGWAREFMAPDPHASGPYSDTYRVTSLYLDTPAFDVFHRRGSYARGKYRIRRYDLSGDAFLERKLKMAGRVNKTRSLVPLSELPRLAASDPRSEWREGYWFHRRLLVRGLQPVCQISYRRTARLAQSVAGPIRLTLDEDLRATPASEFAFDGEDAGSPISPAGLILELKHPGGLPALFKDLLSQFALKPEPFSKYRLAAGAYA